MRKVNNIVSIYNRVQKLISMWCRNDDYQVQKFGWNLDENMVQKLIDGGCMKICTPILVDKKTGLPLNIGGNTKLMRFANINEYYYFEIVSSLVDQIGRDYKLRYSGSQAKTIGVVRMVAHHLFTSEYPLRVSKSPLCTKNTMRDITDRLADMYPRVFQCLRGFPTIKGNVPSVIGWNYATRERFLNHITWYYGKEKMVFNLTDYDPYVFDDKLLEESYLKNKLRR